MAYDGGDMIRIIASYVASGDTPAFPASVYLQLMNPLGSVGTWAWPASVNVIATGTFYADVLASIGGAWHYRWSGIQTFWSAAEGTFSVNQTVFIT
jgi:hypothetical protein